MNKTYEEAYGELQHILHQLKEGNLSMDELSEKVKEAAALISYCKEKLRKSEEEINGIFSQLEDN